MARNSFVYSMTMDVTDGVPAVYIHRRITNEWMKFEAMRYRCPQTASMERKDRFIDRVAAAQKMLCRKQEEENGDNV